MFEIDLGRLQTDIRNINTRMNVNIRESSLWSEIDRAITAGVSLRYSKEVGGLPLSPVTVKIKKELAQKGKRVETLKGVFRGAKRIYVNTFGKRTGTLVDVLNTAAVRRMSSGPGFERDLVFTNEIGLNGETVEYLYRLVPNDFVRKYPALLDLLVRSRGVKSGIFDITEEDRQRVVRLFTFSIIRQLTAL